MISLLMWIYRGYVRLYGCNGKEMESTSLGLRVLGLYEL